MVYNKEEAQTPSQKYFRTQIICCVLVRKWFFLTTTASCDKDKDVITRLLGCRLNDAFQY